ncbi:MAG: PAS domain S-box protein [Chloroflexota bacterium]
MHPVAPMCFAAIAHEVTSHTQLAASLQERAAELHAAQVAGRTGSWTFDVETRRFNAPPATIRLLAPKLNRGLPSPADLDTYLTPSSADRVRKAVADILATGEPRELEAEYVRGDGSTGWVLIRGDVERGEDGTVRRLLGTVTDIEARRQAEQALAASEERFRMMAENATDVLLVASADGWIRYVAPTVETSLGWRPEELVGTSVFDLVLPEDRDDARSFARRLVEGHGDIDIPHGRLLCRDGHAKYMSGRVAPLFGPDGEAASFLVSFRDVDQLVRANQALAAAQEALRIRTAELEEAREIAGLGVWRFVPATSTWTWSPAMKQMYGLDPGAPGPTMADVERMATGDEVQRMEAAFRVAAVSGEPFELESKVATPAGRTRWIRTQGVPEFAPDGRLVAYHGTALDVTARKRFDALFRETLDRMINGCTFIDHELRITYLNEAAAAQLRMPRAEVEGQPIRNLKPEWADTEMAVRFGRVLRDRVPDAFETALPFPDGSTGWFELGLFPVEEGMVMIGMERTEHHRAEAALLAAREELAEARRLESIGRLAGGVAHDLNNTLTAILGHAELARSAAGDEAQVDLAQIRVAAERAKALAQKLLAFGRRSLLQNQRVDVGEVVRSLVPMLSQLIGEDVRLALDGGHGPVPAVLDPSMLEHAIVNLVVNARDAMPGGGRIEVIVRAVDGGADDIPDGRWARIDVVDSGTGMDADTQRRIFEPFFTSKDVGKGTGLGLPMVLGFVDQSGGHVRVKSTPGKGSTFTLLLPLAADGEVGDAAVNPRSATAVRRGSGTILVVEDEAILRMVAGRTLAAAGYTVLTAADGPDAIHVAALHAGSIDLVFADLVMPGMRGTELARSLRSTHPEVKVLLTSGYTAEDVSRRGIDVGADRLLAKPYTPSDLTAAIAEVLAGA